MSDARSAATTPRRTTRKRRDIRERMERAVLDHWELLEDEDIAIFTIRRPDGSDFCNVRGRPVHDACLLGPARRRPAAASALHWLDAARPGVTWSFT